MQLTDTLSETFIDTRKYTETLCEPLETEDYVVQPMADVSPPKWHLGHSTWFFEEVILKPHLPGYQPFHPDYSYVFNSYYESLGKRVVRTDRGNLSRPSVADIYRYRNHVSRAILDLFASGAGEAPHLRALLEIGIHHEMQHQELLLTDIKYILGNNPLLPVYTHSFPEHPQMEGKGEWRAVDAGLYEIGHTGETFCYDNETARHRVYLNSFEIYTQAVQNAEYMEFIEAGGYEHFEFWHAAGWDWVQEQKISAPLYWYKQDGTWFHYTLGGPREVSGKALLTHISYYEAFAYAQWKGCRLPTEFEWEAAQHLFSWGQRWEWTESAYLPYPGYQKAEGPLGEYNGKFMVNQKVLRGSSVATSDGHSRPTYRNFFQPEKRWQYTGLRLAR